MSILNCNEIGDGRGAGIELRDNKRVRTSVRTFRVQSDPGHDEWYILQNSFTASPDPVPDLYDQHPSYPAMRVRSVTPKQEDETGRFWILTVAYDDEVSQDEEDNNPDPIQRRVKYRLEWASAIKIVTHDLDGRTIQNTVFDPFIDPIEEEDDRPVLVAVRNELASTLDSIIQLAIDYKNAVNTDYFHGAQPGYVRCRNIVTGDLLTENEVEYYAVTYEFEYKDQDDGLDRLKSLGNVEGDPEPWDRLVLNRGYRALKEPNSLVSRYDIPNKEAQNISEDGTLFSVGEIENNVAYYYRTFRTKKRRPFSLLQL